MPHRKISRTSSELIDIINQVARIVNISEFQYIVKFGSDESIDNALGDTYKVTIKGRRDSQKIRQSFVVKWISEPKKRLAFRNLYHREYTFYSYVVPKLLEIQNKFKVIEGLKIAFPNCVFTGIEKNKETVVLTPLLQKGYKLHDRFLSTDFEHSSLIIKYLAKLHALFFVLQNIDPNECEVIKLLYQEDIQYGNPKSIPESVSIFYNDSVNVVRDLVAKNKLMECASDIFSVLHKSTCPDIQYNTLCHADCWNNNFCFKYQGERPVDVILIDYFISRYASPVTDISYFLYMTGDQKFLDSYYERLITLYYKTLAAVLRQCNLDVEDIYPEKIFKQHLKDYSVLGLIEALISMKIITAGSEEAIEMIEMRYEIKDTISYDTKSRNQSLFVERINGVVNDFFKRSYSLDAVLTK